MFKNRVIRVNEALKEIIDSISFKTNAIVLSIKKMYDDPREEKIAESPNNFYFKI